MLVFDQLKRSDRHLQVISVGILAGLAILLSGLWYVQVVSARRFRADQQEQSFRSVRVPAIRGKILDRYRQPLVENRPSYNVNLYLEELRRQFYHEYTNSVKPQFVRANPNVPLTRKVIGDLEREARYRVVSNYLFQVSSTIREPRSLVENAFYAHYSRQRSLPFTLLKDLSSEQMALFVENVPDLVSLALDVQLTRFYPYTNLAAHLLGHLQRDDTPAEDEDINYQFRLPDYVGVKGIEAAFDSELRGKAAAKMVLVNRMGYRQSEEVWSSAEPGLNVVLTIDLKIQQATEKALTNVLGRTGKPVRGAAVVLDCTTGDILALESAPSFDPNHFIPGFTHQEWEDAKMTDRELKPLVNRATRENYAPGSVFKIIVGLACLESSTFDPKETIYSPALFRLRPGGHPWRDLAPPGNYDFRKAFFLSSNYYFQTNGLYKAGAKRIIEMGRRFGLGERTGLPKGQDVDGYFPSPDQIVKRDGSRWMDGDTANLCIGQGEIAVTPLQMALMTAAIANGGKLMQPRLIMALEAQDLNSGAEPIRFPAGQVKRDLRIDPNKLEWIRLAMLDDVEHTNAVGRLDGTGKNAFMKDFRVCGKTGTAQVFDENNRYKEHDVWFVSYAPFESPRYAMAIVVEGGGSGGGTCAPVAREIYQAILKREAELKAASGIVASDPPTVENAQPGLTLNTAPPRRIP